MNISKLEALNREILSLARAGVPLGKGLIGVSGSLPRQISQITQRIGQQLEQGQPFEQIVADPALPLPAVYRAVVLAGVKSGRLSLALEGAATTLRRVSEIRRIVGLAIVYPLFVFLLASVLLATIAAHVFPNMLATFTSQGLPEDSWTVELLRLLADSPEILLVIPGGILLLALFWWWQTGQVIGLGASGWTRWTGALPGVHRMLRLGRRATFTEVFRLLLIHQIPIHEALVLAGQSSGDSRLYRDALHLAQRIQHGDVSGVASGGHRDGLPAMICWLADPARSSGDRFAALDLLAKNYYLQTARCGEWMRLYLPVWATLSIGGVTLLVYTVIIFGPWTRLLTRLAQPF